MRKSLILGTAVTITVGFGIVYATIPGYSRLFALPARAEDLSMRSCLNNYIQEVGQQCLKSSKKIAFSTHGITGLGLPEPISYRGRKVYDGSENREAHCIGFAFHTFIRAHEKVPVSFFTGLNVGSESQFKRFRAEFYGPDQMTFVKSLPKYGLGVVVDSFEKALPGDFIQLWRNTEKPSGHCGIFQEWIRDDRNAITGVKILQVGNRTSGVGLIDEFFADTSATQGNMNRSRTYLVRAVIRK